MGTRVGNPVWPWGHRARGALAGTSVFQPQDQTLSSSIGVRRGGAQLAPGSCPPATAPTSACLLQLPLRPWGCRPCPCACMAAPPPSCTGHPSCPVTWPLAGAVLDVTGPGADGLLSHLFPPPGSKSSGSTRSSRRAPGREKERRAAGAGGSGSESDHTAPSGVGSSWRERPAGQLSRGSSPRSQASATAPGLPPPHPMTKAYTVVGGPPGGPPVRELAAVPPELTGSRQSFQKAMGNPCEFFVDIM